MILSYYFNYRHMSPGSTPKPKIERFLNQILVSFIIKQSLKSILIMHILQPKHSKLNEKQAGELLKKLNISKSQLPKILLNDNALPEGCNIGDIIEIKRKEGEKVNIYYRVVV